MATFCRRACLKRCRARCSSTGTGVVFEPGWGSAATQPPPFLTLATSRLVGAALENLTLVGSVFSEAGSWRRDLAAASVSAAGAAAPAQTGPAASWSWTRWTAGNKHSHVGRVRTGSQATLHNPPSGCPAAQRTPPSETPDWSRSCCWDQSGASCCLKMQRWHKLAGSPDPEY